MVRIRISTEANPQPAPGLVGAFGGTISTQSVDVQVTGLESAGDAALLLTDAANAVVQVLKVETALTAEAELVDGTRVTGGTMRHEYVVGDDQRDLEDRA